MDVLSGYSDSSDQKRATPRPRTINSVLQRVNINNLLQHIWNPGEQGQEVLSRFWSLRMFPDIYSMYAHLTVGGKGQYRNKGPVVPVIAKEGVSERLHQIRGQVVESEERLNKSQ